MFWYLMNFNFSTFFSLCVIYKQIVWQFEALRQFCLIISGLVSDIGIFVVKIKKKNQQTKTQKDKNKDQKEFDIVI